MGWLALAGGKGAVGERALHQLTTLRNLIGRQVGGSQYRGACPEPVKWDNGYGYTRRRTNGTRLGTLRLVGAVHLPHAAEVSPLAQQGVEYLCGREVCPAATSRLEPASCYLPETQEGP